MNSKQYLKEHKNSGLKVGDKVKIIMKCPSYARGWNAGWSGYMDEAVGKTGVISCDDNIYGFKIDCWWYPYFVLEKVEYDNVSKDRIFIDDISHRNIMDSDIVIFDDKVVKNIYGTSCYCFDCVKHSYGGIFFKSSRVLVVNSKRDTYLNLKRHFENNK